MSGGHPSYDCEEEDSSTLTALNRYKKNFIFVSFINLVFRAGVAGMLCIDPKWCETTRPCSVHTAEHPLQCPPPPQSRTPLHVPLPCCDPLLAPAPTPPTLALPSLPAACRVHQAGCRLAFEKKSCELMGTYCCYFIQLLHL